MMERFQRRRTRGWRMPEGAVYVGRSSRWGNPFRLDLAIVYSAALSLGVKDRREAAVLLYSAWMRGARRIEPLTQWSPAIEFTEGSVGGSVWVEGSGAHMDLPKVPSLAPLRGKDLVCWCGFYQPCHADVLLELANR